ncbi:MAG: iron transporter, partial [Lachnospiraceae bacterium]|nr:iron transporter [Lachnospiraceae bacterium]
CASVLAMSTLVGCGSSSASTSSAPAEEAVEETAEEETVEEEAAAADVVEETEDAATDGAGFTEYPIFEDEPLAFINLSAVYFQSVPMTDSEQQNYAAEDYDIHLEADISALDNQLGYGVGDWVPYLTVDYAIVDSASKAEVTSGTFMPMAASDGPHYGNNIKLDPGTYDITFTIHSPGENGYLIHSDAQTGPGGLLSDVFGDGPLTYTFEGWEFAGLE